MRRLRLFGFSIGLIPLAGSLFLTMGCKPQQDKVGQSAGGPKVLVSFPPLYSFAQSVAGDDAHVDVLLTGTGPHSEPDPTADQLKLAKNADLFFIIGLNFDEKIAEKIQEAGGKSNTVLVELGERIDAKKLREGGHHHHHDAKHDKHDEHDEHEGHDPHLWLSPMHAKLMVETIRDELKKHDAAHAAGYDRRTAEYGARLDRLLQDGRAMLKDKSEKKIVTFHDSLGYFADSFGLTIAGVVQVDAGHEPSTEHIKELIEICKAQKVRVIAVEPQFKRNHAEVLLRALRGAFDQEPVLVEIDPIETADDNEIDAELYERKMRTNLKNLADVLK